MICETVEELTPLIGTQPACRALGASPATIYRRRRPPEPRAPKPRPTPERALSPAERERVLEVLQSERFVDVAPEEAWATLLDEGNLSVLDPDDVPDPRRPARRRPRPARSAHPPRIREARVVGRAAERAVVVGREQAAGSGDVDVLLPLRGAPRLLRRREERMVDMT
jgi:hypothetical protein